MTRPAPPLALVVLLAAGCGDGPDPGPADPGGRAADGSPSPAGRAEMLREMRAGLPLERLVAALDPADPRLAAAFAALAETREVAAHRLRGADENVVYVDPAGRREAVYDAAGDLVTDYNAGSYNYFPAAADPPRHFTFDTLPWLAFGASRDDPTAPAERADAFARDLAAGAARAAGPGAGPVGRPDLAVPGTAEAAAVLLAAADRGGVPDFLAAAPPPADVPKFAAGLRAALGFAGP